jgi:hypothetical protein
MFYTRIRIEKGIPIPPVKTRGKEGRTSPKYPWRDMKVNDSFLFPAHVARGAFAAAALAEKYTGYRFVVRRMEDGYRCWRVA